MNPRTTLWTLAFVLSAFIGATVRADDEPVSVFRAGAAVADITPQKWPVFLVGSFSRRPATHAWDPLSARALVLDNGSRKIGFVVVDSCFCPRSLFDEARQRAEKVTGIKADHLLMSATHTHSAPASKNGIVYEADPEYVEHMIRGIVSALHQATANLAPAEVGWGTAQVPEEVFNRRWFMNAGGIVANPFGELNDQVRMNPPRGRLLNRPAGPTDPEVCFLSLRTAEDQRPIALLANYSLHYVGGVPAGGVSADYFGEFARQITQRLFPEGRVDARPPFVGILSNGTSGDVNNINFTNPRPRAKPFERIRIVASRVADRVHDALKTVKYRTWIPLEMVQSDLSLKVRKPTDAQVARAMRFLAEEDESKLPPRAKAYAQWTIMLHKHPGTENLLLQVVRVGDVGITSIPCEVFAEIGLSLKAKSPLKSTFTIELANGHNRYLPTPRQHDLGGYETWMGTNIMEKEASVKIEARLLELLEYVAAP